MASFAEVDDSPEAVNAHLYSQRMTDGLPVVPPTEDRVAQMVAASGRGPDDSVGDFPPLNAPATIEKIAINAVMAGCEPAYMPAIIAITAAVLDPVFSLQGIQTTTNPVGPIIVFNGPVREELGINCGAGCLGPGTKANATIGRALRLAMINVGGALPGDVDKAALGWPGKSTSVCFGENEEETPWEPLHAERGFARTDSTVTVVPASGMWPITDMSPDSESVLHHVTYGMATSGHSGGSVPERHEQVLVMSPVIAQMVAKLAPEKNDVKRHLFERSLIDLDWYPPNRHAESHKKLEALGIESKDGKVPIAERWEDFVIVVAGGMGGLQSCGVSCMLGKSVTRKIEKAS